MAAISFTASKSSMTCPCCHLQRDRLYCAECLRQGITLHNDLLTRLQTHIDALTRKAEQLLTQKVTQWRELRADISSREQRCFRLRREIADREARISDARSKAGMREQLPLRRKAMGVEQDLLEVARSIKQTESQQRRISTRIRLARHVLVREAVSLFGVRKSTEKYWEIARVLLPSPESFRLYSSAGINAALSHVVHLMSLITNYLSIALPYEPVNSLQRHVGKLFIRPYVPFVGSTKWREKSLLWMSSSASVSKGTTTNAITKSSSKHRHFLTSFALLSYSIAYLAWSQGVPWVGVKNDEEEKDETQAADHLISATSILELIQFLARDPSLGRKTHEPGTVPILKHLGFGLDVAKVVQTVLTAEQKRWGTLVDDSKELSEDWDVIDDDR